MQNASFLPTGTPHRPPLTLAPWVHLQSKSHIPLAVNPRNSSNDSNGVRQSIANCGEFTGGTSNTASATAKTMRMRKRNLSKILIGFRKLFKIFTNLIYQKIVKLAEFVETLLFHKMRTDKNFDFLF